jgi:PAS domain S-box-containing protein
VAIITRVTIAIALIVAVSPPLSYFWLTYAAQENEVAMEARLHAAFITQLIVSSPDKWQTEVADLIDQNLTDNALPETRYIRDVTGTLVANSQNVLRNVPVIKGVAQLVNSSGTRVASLEVQRSLSPVIYNTILILLISCILGVTIFTTLRSLPLRALKRALTSLHQEKLTLQENEERLRIVINNAVDGILTLNQFGLIESINPAAERIFGYRADEIVGWNIEKLIPFKSSSIDENGAVKIVEQRGVIATHKDGSIFPVEFSLSEAHLKGKQKFIAILRDVTERKAAEEKLSYLANYDSLTSLPNRSLFRDRLKHAMARADRNNRLAGLMFLDLDRFKAINDTLGHEVGDELLKHVAKVLQNCLRKYDTICRMDDRQFPVTSDSGYTVSRLGGDEFTVILEDVTHANDASIAAKKILTAFAENPFVREGKVVYVSTSIGITLYPLDNTDIDGLIKQADLAMYRAKELGRNASQFYTEDLNTKASKLVAMEADLRLAIERDEFLLYYQPKLEIATGKICGAEALIRWQHPVNGLIPPNEFIPLLEETGLILQVGEWVIRTACTQLKLWHDNGLNSVHVAVNLSSRQFRQKDLSGTVMDILDKTGLPANALELEVTESLLMENVETSIEMLLHLQKMGVSISVDDFGTGYSSLSYLKRLPINTLKIDQSFVRDIATDPDDAAIATAIIGLAHNLRLKVVAEGVETEEQLQFMRERNCDQMQGYLLSRPLPADKFEQWIRARLAETLS